MKIYHDITGLFHLATAVIALISGTFVIIDKKGSKRHKVIGYIYFINMLALNLSAFMIYRLFGGFGIFHIAAIISLATTVAGMIPIFTRPKNWISQHFSFMYWSVIGLYAAFASEILTRIPETPFFGMVGIATGIIMITAHITFRYKKHSWFEEFNFKNN